MRFYHGLSLLLSTSVPPTALGAATRLQPASQNHHELRSLSKATNGTVTKTFKFKDDFFLRISTLSTAISPGNNTDELLGALEEYAETFRDEWVEALTGETLPDNCAVLVRSTPLCTIRIYFDDSATMIHSHNDFRFVSRLTLRKCPSQNSQSACGAILIITISMNCLRRGNPTFIPIPM